MDEFAQNLGKSLPWCLDLLLWFWKWTDKIGSFCPFPFCFYELSKDCWDSWNTKIAVTLNDLGGQEASERFKFWCFFGEVYKNGRAGWVACWNGAMVGQNYITWVSSNRQVCNLITHTQTTVLRPSWILSGTTQVSRHQKGKNRNVKPIWIYWSKS